MRATGEPVGGMNREAAQARSEFISLDDIDDGNGSRKIQSSGESPHGQDRQLLNDPVRRGGDACERQQQNLDAQRLTAFWRSSSDSILSDLSLYSGIGHGFSSNFVDRQPILQSPSFAVSDEYLALSPNTPRTWSAMLRNSWAQSKGLFMVMLSQFFGASMNVMARALEMPTSQGEAFGPFQILIARMSITCLASYVYIWYKNVTHPFGTRDVLWLLLLRACGGFFGCFGMYASLLYLQLSEATVLSFLAPMMACYACSFFVKNEVFTRKQQLAAFISLIGVVLIARPFAGRNSSNDKDTNVLAGVIEAMSHNATSVLGSSENYRDSRGSSGATTKTNELDVDFKHHILAIGAALLGVCGGACALTAIRVIGTRTHPLVSVTYFSLFTTIVSAIAILVIPSVVVRLPHSLAEWLLLLGLGISGFFLQYLLTAGLAYVPPQPRQQRYATEISLSTPSSSHGSRATSMLYTQMLFALFYDKIIWNTSPSILSWTGSGLILGSALYIALVRGGSRNISDINQGHEMVEGVVVGDRCGQEHTDMSGISGRFFCPKDGNQQTGLRGVA